MRFGKRAGIIAAACLAAASLAFHACAEGAAEDAFVSERISRNYTAVSASYTYPVYRGADIPLSPAEAARELRGAEETGETAGYSGGDTVLRVHYGDVIRLRAEIPEDGLYALKVDYYSYDDAAEADRQSLLPDKLALSVDGEYPFYECRNLKFESSWLRQAEAAYDRYGDEMAALPVKMARWETKTVTDSTGRRTDPLLLELAAGEHELALEVKEGSFLLGNLTFCAPEEIPEDGTAEAAEGSALITLQGEEFLWANSSSIHGVMEYDAAVEPYDVQHTRLNTIDSDSFRNAGDSVTWETDVPADGRYYIALNYRQSDKTDFPVFADILVDGRIPSAAFRNCPLAYGTSWQRRTLADADGNCLSVYLSAGRHELTIRLTIDPLRQAMETLDRIMYGVNDLALEITRVAGTNADKYRDLKLSRYIPGLTDTLRGYAAELRETEQNYIRYSASDRNVAVMASMLIAARQLESLAENPDEIPYRIGELSSSSNSANQYLANTVDNLLRCNLAVDRIWLYQEDAELPASAGFLEGAGKSAERFASSFSSQRYSTANTDPSHLQVWVNRSNQYVQIMQKLIDERFTPETGIRVDISLMPDQYKLVLARSSGNAPDVATGINYTIPYELAIRGALKDLTEFDSFREVASVYEPGFFLTGTIGDGIYSMPETLNFWVLFYRTDVMEKLNLPVPETMDDVIALLPELQMRGLNFYYATAGMLSMRNFHGTTPLLVQNGGSLYYETADLGTALGSRESVTGFTALTDLFTIYNMPVSVDNFYQHFRNGDMPIGIADFYTYNLIRNAAPELDSSWAIALIPGTRQADGSVDRTTCGCAESTVIFTSTPEREQQAWQFIEWWSSTEIQALFGRTVQSIYGDEYIWPTANLEAFDLLPWDTEDKLVIRAFAENVVDVARVPGTYMLEREMSNAFNDITVNGANEQTRLDRAVKTINREIRRKLEEFGYIASDGRVIREYRIPTVESVKKLLGR
ncbi:MAG: extracellular solute-binding protein [Clostridiales bacterium]|nr:extracellular solute-binding protein [Clostridiales bacterium]